MKQRSSMMDCLKCLDGLVPDGECDCAVDMDVCDTCQAGPLSDGQSVCPACIAERQRFDMIVNELKPMVFRLVFWASVGGALIGLGTFLILVMIFVGETS